MNSRYRLIDLCLDVLRHCDMPAMTKLRLEVQLFQIKLLLLGHNVSADIKGRYCSEAVLKELHHQMAGLRDTAAGGDSIEAVRLRLQQIALDLSEANAATHSLLP